MTDFSLDKKIAELVNSEDFFDTFKENLDKIKDPEKRVKFMESLMSYQVSKLKNIDAIPEDRFRAIEITYQTQTGQETISKD